jgi:hypothetical protein
MDDFAVLLIGLLFFGSEDTLRGFGACGMVGTLGGVGLLVGHRVSLLQIKNGLLFLAAGPFGKRFAFLITNYHKRCGI